MVHKENFPAVDAPCRENWYNYKWDVIIILLLQVGFIIIIMNICN